MRRQGWFVWWSSHVIKAPYIAVGVAKYIFSDGPKIYGNKPVVHVCVVATYLVVLPQWDVQH